MFVEQSFVLNGRPHGAEADRLSQVQYDPNLMRPYIDDRGERCVLVRKGMVFNNQTGKHEPAYTKRRIADLIANGIYDPVFNATAFRKEEWVQLDQVVLRAARLRLRAWADLAASASYGGFNGMAKLVLEHETMSDPGEAVVDMDGMTQGRGDEPIFQLQGTPLPITHSDFYFTRRQLAVSQNTGTPLDTVGAEAAGRRVAEKVEQTTIGVQAGFIGAPAAVASGYGRSPATVYGYSTFPARQTYSGATAPVKSGWTPQTTINDVLGMITQMINQRFYGPFMVYHSNDWDKYMDGDYSLGVTGGSTLTLPLTLRERLEKIEYVAGVRRLDFLTSTTNPYNLLLVQMDQGVARAIIGMDITTVQWETVGGMRLNFKVMAIMVPEIRADFYGRCGVMQAICAQT